METHYNTRNLQDVVDAEEGVVVRPEERLKENLDQLIRLVSVHMRRRAFNTLSNAGGT